MSLKVLRCGSERCASFILLSRGAAGSTRGVVRVMGERPTN